MAFRCYLRPGTTYDAQFFEISDHLSAEISIGYDDETGSTFQLLTSLEMIAGAGPRDFDQIFMIVENEVNEMDPQSPFVYAYYSGRETKNKIPSLQDRLAILEALSAATEILVRIAKPKKLTVTTHDAYLPEKALLKYEHILAVYRKLGFYVKKGEPYLGIHIWMAERM